MAAATLSRPNSDSLPRPAFLGNVDEPKIEYVFLEMKVYVSNKPFLPLYRGSCERMRAYCSAVIQVHCGSRAARDGLAGVLSGFRFVLILPLPGGSNLSE